MSPAHSSAASSSTAASSAMKPRMLSHAAYVTHDVATTVEFYTKALGMEFCHTVIDSRIPSTGDPVPYMHLFFRMADGSTMAFFEAPGLPPAAPPSHPAYPVFNHFAFSTNSEAEVQAWKDRLESHGVSVLGPVDHGIATSIYFHDPNGIRLEFTYPYRSDWLDHSREAYAELASWVKVKEGAKRDGRDVSEALVKHIQESQALAKATEGSA